MARSKQGEIKRKKYLLTTLKQKNATEKKTATGDIKKERKPRKWRPGTVAARDVKRAMRQTHPLIPKSQIFKIAREICTDMGKTMRFQDEAINALREAITAFGVDCMSYSNKVRMLMGKELTLASKHMQVGRALMGVPSLSDTAVPMYKKFAKERQRQQKHLVMIEQQSKKTIPTEVDDVDSTTSE